MEKLKETCNLMLSTDYKDRFKAEYMQLKIRYEKLNKMLLRWSADRLDFIPTCPYGIYEMQRKSMLDYLSILEARALMEDIPI